MSPAAAALALGAALCLAGWSAGSTPLWIAGLGLVLAGGWAVLWSRVVGRRICVDRGARPGTLIEGEPLRYDVRLHGARRVPGAFAFVEQLGPVGAVEVRLHRSRVVAVGVRSASRGRYPIGPGRVIGVEPLGLGRAQREVPADDAVLVVPRVPVLEHLFSDRGRARGDGARALVRRGGVEPHGVREYQEGEPMRAVHWATSARRGRLMVRELEDAARDEVVVVLDLDAGADVGPPGSRSVDEAVRAAAAIVRAHVARGRRTALVVAGAVPARSTASSLGREWDDVLVALALAEPTGRSSAGDVVAGRGGAASTNAALTLVTLGSVAGPADALLARAGSAVVVVDAPTYAGASATPPEPALLRLAAHGVPVAVVRRGDDLAAALAGGLPAVAHA